MFAIWASPTVALYFGLSSTIHFTHCFCICMVRLPCVVVRGCGRATPSGDSKRKNSDSLHDVSLLKQSADAVVAPGPEEHRSPRSGPEARTHDGTKSASARPAPT